MAMAGLGLDSDDKKERTGNTLTGEQLLDFGLFFSSARCVRFVFMSISRRRLSEMASDKIAPSDNGQICTDTTLYQAPQAL
jgi:hypothetical protein